MFVENTLIICLFANNFALVLERAFALYFSTLNDIFTFFLGLHFCWWEVIVSHCCIDGHIFFCWLLLRFYLQCSTVSLQCFFKWIWFIYLTGIGCTSYFADSWSGKSHPSIGILPFIHFFECALVESWPTHRSLFLKYFCIMWQFLYTIYFSGCLISVCFRIWR